MKVIDVAIKDLLRVFRSPSTLIMMLGAPLLIAGLLYFAFGSMSSGTGRFTLPRTQVVVVNLDAAGSSRFKAGEMLISFLQNEDLASMLEIRVAQDEATARAAVDTQKADVALIIPANFSQAASTPGQKASLTFYQDPTLSVGPGIVRDLVKHYMDGFSGASIAAEVAMSSAPKDQNNAGLAGSVMRSYAAYLQSSDHDAALHAVSPSGVGTQPKNGGASLIGPIMAGMLVFFVFFMGANGAQSIIEEHEEGTLARLFTTPTSHISILAGKFLAVFSTLVIQSLVLILASALLFRIVWGQLPSVLLSAFGLIVCGTGFGVMLMSFIKEARQTGPILGGVLTVTGMLGGLFTTGIPNLPAVMEKVTLTMPQGWAMRAMKLCLAGSAPSAILGPALVLFALGVAFFLVGLSMFRRRFA
ncbi:MAG: ABC transporter permease [Anaerolineae bacterium]